MPEPESGALPLGDTPTYVPFQSLLTNRASVNATLRRISQFNFSKPLVFRLHSNKHENHAEQNNGEKETYLNGDEVVF
jgi:hypothetical protein